MWNFQNSYPSLPEHFYSKQNPVSVSSPQFAFFNNSLAEYLNIPKELNVYAGNAVPKGAEPLAQAYAGHQFGHFTMLGDGRAILLGEQITNAGERFDIQLKGSGVTPYSRGGDGRAALGPMLREYIISEAMHALGIPTTRSLAVVTTGETVIREKLLQGAVLTRVAASHIRVGTFEYAARFSTIENVRTLADYTIKRHFPHITESKDKYLLMLQEVVKQQASLIAKWQLVGFIHGVMNTDNMAVSGETIDYGPCAFMDMYNPATVFNSIDRHGRYSYENQPFAAAWNLARLAEALLPLLHNDMNKAVKLGNETVSGFHDLFKKHHISGMRAKLGLCGEESDDEHLINELLDLMKQLGTDYMNTFRTLTIKQEVELTGFEKWQRKWQKLITSESSALMERSNPAVIPRNHRVEEALEAAENGDFNVMSKLLRVLENPYKYSHEQEEYAELPATCSCCYQTFCGT